MGRWPSFPPQACWLCFFLLLAGPALAGAAEYRLVSDTLLRGFETNVGGDEDLVLPLYQYLQADVGTPGEPPLTFHLYGWGRVELAGSDHFERTFAGGDDTAGELLYGYLEYVSPEVPLTARLGRQYVFEGVARESIDGLRLDAGLSPWFSLCAYGGWPVGLDATDGRSGDSIYGGRFTHHRRGLYEVGLSYKNVDNDSRQAEELLGLDFSLLLPAGISFFGYSTYNLESSGWAEDYYELRLAFDRLQLRPFFQRFDYDDYFATGANTGRPFRFLAGTGETVNVFGTDLLWLQSEVWEWGLKAKHYDYDERDNTAQFLSALLTWSAEEGRSQAGGELGWMNGDSAENEYLLSRLFVYWDLPQTPLLDFATADLVYVWYDETIHGDDDSFFLTLGGGTRLLQDRLELKVAADYSSDPYFDDDLRGWLLATYVFSR
ncbi:MAG: hypothetical protein IH614_11055 [Desulfuromonadales bacterium]|nr:hypothetical protein [Desulfuromonadales bacterium]